jgi:hypothetical protein
MFAVPDAAVTRASALCTVTLDGRHFYPRGRFHQAAWARAAIVSKRWPICTVPAEFSLFTSTYWNCSINETRRLP